MFLLTEMDHREVNQKRGKMDSGPFLIPQLVTELKYVHTNAMFDKTPFALVQQFFFPVYLSWNTKNMQFADLTAMFKAYFN